MAQRPNWMNRAIPIAIHGDAVPCVAVGKAGTSRVALEVHLLTELGDLIVGCGVVNTCYD